jgi:hypothetical protein
MRLTTPRSALALPSSVLELCDAFPLYAEFRSEHTHAGA